LVIWSFFAGNLKIVPFRTASGKIPKASAGLGLEQRFFLMKALLTSFTSMKRFLNNSFLKKSYWTLKPIFTDFH